MSSDNLDNLIEEALENIRNDRKVAREFLNEIANQIAVDAEHNKHLSPVAAKHIETMQRSNEQLVMIAALIQKKEKAVDGISEQDKQELFDLIKEGD